MRIIKANIINDDVKEAEEVESAAISASEFIEIPLYNEEKNSM